MNRQALNHRYLRRRAFTLVEVLVTTVLVSIAVVGVFGAIRALERTEERAHTVDFLQSLAAEKLNDVSLLTDPSSQGTSGDFSDRGYPNIRWDLEEESTDITNVDQETVTVTKGLETEKLTRLMYLAPQTTTGAAGAATP